MDVGTASADPGEISRGWLDATTLPTGGRERLPVVVAAGETEGPMLWLTASIHGDEVTAMATAQDVVDERLPGLLRGTVVCLPNLNPAGLRRTSRTSYYHDDDPNRYFPAAGVEHYRPPRVQELIDGRVFDAVADSADALVDLHTAQVDSLPFVIRDRVLYGEHRHREAAESLAAELDRLVGAFGLPVLTEYTADEYTGENLHRSTAGAALNEAGIPAFTAELGTHSVVDEANRARGVVGCYRVMVELGMLDAVPAFVPDPGPVSSPVDFPVKRAVGPHTETAGIVRHRVEPGDVLAAGDTVADVVSPHGEHWATVCTDQDGFVVARSEGLAVYENDPLVSLGVRDDGDLVVERERPAGE